MRHQEKARDKMDKLLEYIGANIKKTREGMGLTQGELARKTAKNKSSISNIENGRGNPTLESLMTVADALGVKAWELLRPSLEVKNWYVLEEFQQYIAGEGGKITSDDNQFLRNLRVKGSPPQNKETYLLFWLLLRWVTDKDLPNFFKMELSKADGDIIGTFKIHMG
jgi:transcriptional regulator with XRE-family HTH domain